MVVLKECILVLFLLFLPLFLFFFLLFLELKDWFLKARADVQKFSKLFFLLFIYCWLFQRLYV